jgi:hypothetical protein
MSQAYITRRGLNNTTATLTFKDYIPQNLINGPYIIESPITIPFDGLGSGSIDKYVLFAGGETDSTDPDTGEITYLSSNVVYAFDNNLVVTSPTVLSEARGYMSSASNNYVLFFSGRYWSNQYASLIASQKVDAYDSSLVHTTFTQAEVSIFGAAANTSDYFLFAGGYMNTGSEAMVSDYISIYDTSLVVHNSVKMITTRAHFCGGTFKDRAWFGGTEDLTQLGVDVLDNSLVVSEAPALQAGRQDISIYATNSHILFAGGLDGNKDETTLVDVYTVDDSGSIVHSVGPVISGGTSGNRGGSFSLAAVFASQEEEKYSAYTDKLQSYNIPDSTDFTPIIAATNSNIVYYPLKDYLLYFTFNTEKTIHIYKNSKYTINGTSGEATDDMDVTEQYPINGTIDVVSTSYP